MSYIKIILISLLTCSLGVALFLLHNHLIIIVPRPQEPQSSAPTIKQAITFFYPGEINLKKEAHSLILSSDQRIALDQLVTEWLNFIYQENVITKKISIQSVALNAQNDNAYISFDSTPFTKNQSTLSKLMLVEALFKTISATIPALKKVALLSNNKPLNDYHLDFSYPFPVTGYQESQPTEQPKKQPGARTLLIDPCGDAQHKGRTIADSFERTVAFQCAHLIKKAILAENPNINVLVLQTAHDAITPLQRATLANKKSVDLVVSLNFYQECATTQRCMLYYYLRDPEKDFWTYKRNRLTLEPYDQAYKTSLAQSYATALQLKESISDSSNIFACEVLGIPYKPLLGIIKPALALEVGIKSSADLQTLVPVLAQALSKACTNS